MKLYFDHNLKTIKKKKRALNLLTSLNVKNLIRAKNEENCDKL